MYRIDLPYLLVGVGTAAGAARAVAVSTGAHIGAR